MTYSGHLVFWFSMKYYSETLSYFATHAPSLTIDPFPLIWGKSDNVGVLPDSERGPRRVYETALFASRNDRKIIRSVGNFHSAPTSKKIHPSEKPIPMLGHFFRMLVDGGTNFLDPTCGSGNSLIAAEAAGAERVMGLELDKGFAEAAKKNLRDFRVLREASK